MSPKCPHCNADLAFGWKHYGATDPTEPRLIAIFCKACGACLTVQPDPVRVAANLRDELLAELRRPTSLHEQP
jgi:hypothetical protein